MKVRGFGLLVCGICLGLLFTSCAPPAPPPETLTEIPQIYVTPQPVTAAESSKTGLQPFGPQDLSVEGICVGRSTLQDVMACIGAPQAQDAWIEEASATPMLYWTYEGVYLWGKSADLAAQPEDPAAYVLSMVSIENPDIYGPRGIRVGDTMDAVLTKFQDGHYPDAGGQRVLYANHPLQAGAVWPDALAEMPLLPPYGVVQNGDQGTQIGYLFVMDEKDAPTTLEQGNWVYAPCASLLIQFKDAKVSQIALSVGPLAE